MKEIKVCNKVLEDEGNKIRLWVERSGKNEDIGGIDKG